MSATDAKIALDLDAMKARQTAQQICYALERYIPAACFNDAVQDMAEMCYKNGLELTNKLMRKEYEAWKELTMDKMEMVNPVYKVPER